MFASVLSAAILGMDVHPIQVEADVSDGLPTFTMVGFPSAPGKGSTGSCQNGIEDTVLHFTEENYREFCSG